MDDDMVASLIEVLEEIRDELTEIRRWLQNEASGMGGGWRD
ncbi:MAG: hypothetical protein ACE5Z5_12170 [Candidatus Bathyarchaeia archaeon]